MNTPTVPPSPPPVIIRVAQGLARWLRALSLKLAPAHFGLMELVNARWISDALGAIARLGVADALSQGPRSAQAVAEELELQPDGLYRLLRALAREGLLTESSDGRFGLTALTEPLRADHPSTMRNVVLNLTAEHNARTWARLHDTVRTGERAWDTLHDVDIWTFLAQNPHAAEWFHGMMAELTRDVAPAVARAYPFKQHRSLVDLGGGTGTLLATLLHLTPGLRGVLLDQAEVVAEAPEVLARWQVADRVQIEVGDAFERVPQGHDAYLAKHILHAYADPKARAALKLWRAAIQAEGRLLLVELVVPGPGQPFMGMLDLQMLIGTDNGRERTRAEWEALLREGGFELVAVHATASPFAVIEARPI